MFFKFFSCILQQFFPHGLPSQIVHCMHWSCLLNLCSCRTFPPLICLFLFLVFCDTGKRLGLCFCRTPHLLFGFVSWPFFPKLPRVHLSLPELAVLYTRHISYKRCDHASWPEGVSTWSEDRVLRCEQRSLIFGYRGRGG